MNRMSGNSNSASNEVEEACVHLLDQRSMTESRQQLSDAASNKYGDPNREYNGDRNILSATFDKMGNDSKLSEPMTIREYLISNSEWNHLLWVTGAFHYPLFDIFESPAAAVVQAIACLGFLFSILGCVYDLYCHSILYVSTAGVAYIIGDIVVLLQNASVVVGIHYAMHRMNNIFGGGEGTSRSYTSASGRMGSRSFAGEASCFDYALRKSRAYIIVAVLMFTFTASVILYNGYTAVTYFNFAVSVCTVVLSLVVSNFLSLWMVIFIWIDMEASARVVASAVNAASEGKMTTARYYRKLNQFRRRMAHIGGLLDTVVMVAYINTIAFGFILVVCPPDIALSYMATFGREPIILLLILPDIAAVNDRHSELLRAVAESDVSEDIHEDGVRTSTYIAPSPHREPSIARYDRFKIDTMSTVGLKGESPSRRVQANDPCVDIESPFSSATKILQDQIDQLRLWVAVSNSPLHIPIFSSKIVTKDNLRTQLTGSILFVVTVALKMLFEKYVI